MYNLFFLFNDAVASYDMMISKRLIQTDKEERCRILIFMYNHRTCLELPGETAKNSG
jgi:hypothetical protein